MFVKMVCPITGVDMEVPEDQAEEFEKRGYKRKEKPKTTRKGKKADAEQAEEPEPKPEQAEEPEKTE